MVAVGFCGTLVSMKVLVPWTKLSRDGVRAALARHLAHKVILGNQMALSIGLEMSVGALNQWPQGYSPLAP